MAMSVKRSTTKVAVAATLTLRYASQAGERTRRDTMNEYRPDHGRGGEYPDERPTWPIPHVQDANVRPAVCRREAPLDVHPCRDTAHVPEPDCRRRVVDFHLGQPPRRPAQQSEGTVGRHLDEPATIAGGLANPHEAVMREMRRPFFYVPDDFEHGADRRPHDLRMRNALLAR